MILTEREGEGAGSLEYELKELSGVVPGVFSEVVQGFWGVRGSVRVT